MALAHLEVSVRQQVRMMASKTMGMTRQDQTWQSLCSRTPPFVLRALTLRPSLRHEACVNKRRLGSVERRDHLRFFCRSTLGRRRSATRLCPPHREAFWTHRGIRKMLGPSPHILPMVWVLPRIQLVLPLKDQTDQGANQHPAIAELAPC